MGLGGSGVGVGLGVGDEQDANKIRIMRAERMVGSEW